MQVRRMPFERPTDHYDAGIADIDEQICALIKQRKNISNNNPGYPPFELISDWAEKYSLYEEFLKSLFGNLRNEEHYRPRVEPTVFRKHVPVLQSVEVGEDMYTVTFVRQYENASVVNLHVDSPPRENDDGVAPRRRQHFFQLSIAEGYECRTFGGSGGNGHHTHEFVVAPPLPDDLMGLQFSFEEYASLFGEPTGFQVVINID